ncbi:uncharacterized protein [Populus alba]|nr:uncharacterized protein LOC118049938 isoform X1 [Populus alba]
MGVDYITVTCAQTESKIQFRFRFIFLAITALSSLVSRLIFSATAHLLVLIIQGCRLPGQAVQGGLQVIADVIRACFEYVLQFIVEKICSSTAAAVDLLIEGISGSAALTGSALGGLVEKTRASLDGILENSLSQLAEDFRQMISTIMTDLWSNYKDAVGYFTQNA